MRRETTWSKAAKKASKPAVKAANKNARKWDRLDKDFDRLVRGRKR